MRGILRVLKPGRRFFLFLDYDGTLVPIRRDPDRAVLPLRKKRILEALGERMLVCIVSGRSLADIRSRVGLKGLAYIGNHGLEANWGQRSWIHPRAQALRPALGRLLKRLERRIREFPRSHVEDKGVTGSIHFRRMNTALVEPLKAVVTEEVGRLGKAFRLAEGKRVIEILPRLDWHKGAGIRKFMSWMPPGPGPLRIFIGDDRTDEDAFRTLGGDSMTIHVGHEKETGARFRLAGVGQVWTFLSRCLRLVQDQKGAPE